MAGMARRGVNYWLINIPTRQGVTPKLRRALSISVFPMTHEIVGAPGSFNLGGMLC
jgi:hypothetical protein